MARRGAQDTPLLMQPMELSGPTIEQVSSDPVLNSV